MQPRRVKNIYRQKLGRKVDWGAFLLGLGSGFLTSCLVADGLKERIDREDYKKAEDLVPHK